MIDHTIIKPIVEINRKIYGYTIPDIPDRERYVKIGQTERDVETRIHEQIGTVGVKAKIYFKRKAQRIDGTYFTDKNLHNFLLQNDIKKANFGTEWFYFGDHPENAEIMTDKYINLDYSGVQKPDESERCTYTLRKEQNEAVEKTIQYYDKTQKDDQLSKEFLWNAKPRFGKTLTTYDMIRRLKLKSVLIVTNRPAVANSWYDDFVKFIKWQAPKYLFISESDSITKKGPLTHEEYEDAIKNDETWDGFIAFYSLQDLKGSDWAGGEFSKHEWINGQEFDLVVIDEAHEAVETFKTDKLFEKIKRKFTLHLSGTPFKALASNRFTEEQIYNWSYVDEQKAKRDCDVKLDTNPYENLPTLHLFTYQISNMMNDFLSKGIDIDDKNIDYTFDLNEFFSTNENGKFVYEESVKLFLDNICQGKYPFAPAEYEHKLNHTLWLLHRVDSAKALEKMLREHPFFKEYKVVLAAGDGEVLSDDGIEDDKLNEKSKKSLEKVREAIEKYDKTITLSVGQLTTGVTVPEWTGVMMLSNIKSPALYFQAAFRSQNPYEFTDDKKSDKKSDNKLYVKENAYVFDFAPERTLVQFDEFANNLRPDRAKTSGDRKDNLRELLNFFPVIAEDDKGHMKELDTEEVLKIPSNIKSKQVVKSGFMSNLLFKNVYGIFRASELFKDIIGKLKKPFEEKKAKKDITIPADVKVDEEGNIEVNYEKVINTADFLCKEKVYSSILPTNIDLNKPEDDFKTQITKAVDELVENKMDFSNLKETYNMTDRELKNNKEEMKTKIINNIEKERQSVEFDLKTSDNTIKNLNEKIEKETEETKKEEYKAKIEAEEQNKIKIENNFKEKLTEIIKNGVEEHIEDTDRNVQEKKKKTTEDEYRERLRGFTRTIPSFLMAYGNRDITLQNYDTKVHADDFLDVTGITVDEFKKLRDGFIYTDDDGEEKQVSGLFDESVFNNSIQEFFDTKERLSEYYNKKQDEDVFDYIPSQKTNQKFTPKRVVNMMLDILEKENPDVFKDKNLKFADLYSKSGIFIVEIIKRLNKGLEERIPDQKERLKWIIENQVYALAPTETIYNITKNYVMSNFEGISDKNIKHFDLTPSAKEGKAKEEIERIWGENMKFDIIIGNPPYQENIEHRSEQPALYNYFYDSAFELADIVTFITPARFLFNAGSTPRKWNERMLNDEHFKVVYFEQSSQKIFTGTDIKGGLAIGLYNKNQTYNPIGIFTPYEHLKSIIQKVDCVKNLSDILHSTTSYRYSKLLLEKNPEFNDRLSGGPRRYAGSSVFDTLPEIFFDEKPNDGLNYIKLYGRQDSKRKYKYVLRDYFINHENLDKYKVILPAANGSGAIGEVLSTPLIGEPLIGHTQTFISFGAFDNRLEAENLLKYIKTKFARAMLGVKKTTQSNSGKEVWKYVPLQDFTENSDIDWTKSIPEIDKELYKKYKLSQEEIDFIEEKVAPME